MANVDFSTAQDFEYFDRVDVSATNAVVTTPILVQSSRVAPDSNFGSGKVSNPFLIKAVRMVMYIIGTTTGLTVQNVSDLIEVAMFSTVILSRGTEQIGQYQTSAFFDAFPAVAEKGTAASLTGVTLKSKVVPYNSEVVLMPADAVSGQVIMPAISGLTTIVTGIALRGKLAKRG